MTPWVSGTEPLPFDGSGRSIDRAADIRAYNAAVPGPDQHMDAMTIEPVVQPFRASMTPPGSKSITNRHLVLAALARGRSTVSSALAADDTLVCIEALRTLGVKVKTSDIDRRGNWSQIIIDGCDGTFPGGGQLDLHNAGTAVRFLTAAATLASDTVTIDGNERMRQRPMANLVEALNELGASIESASDGRLPLFVKPLRPIGGPIEIGRTASSQFISALLLAGPCMKNGLEIVATAPLTSASYIALTLDCMRIFGADVSVGHDGQRLAVKPGGYVATDATVEPDASSAVYFLAAAALIPGAVTTIEALGHKSAQPDARFVDVLTEMGAGITYGADFLTCIGAREPLRAIDVDMALMPDAALSAAVLGAFSVGGQMVIRGLHTLRHKETDRLAALSIELRKLGATVEIEDDGDDVILVIEAAPDAAGRTDPVTIDTYNDHRMAMAFSLAGLVRSGVTIADPGCVEKTYPNYWADLRRCVAGTS